MIWAEFSYNRFDDLFEEEQSENKLFDLSDINIHYDENEEE